MLNGIIAALLWTLRIGAFTASALVCLFLALTAFCGCGVEAARINALDNGRTVLEGGSHVQDLPIWVSCHCSDIPCAELVEAASWWNYQLVEHGATRPVVMVAAERSAGTYGCFVEGELPPELRSEERAYRWSSGVMDGTVAFHGRWIAVLQRGEWDQGVIRHAMGHAMGLDEDPSTEVTLDLRSIMQSDAPIWGQVTPGDAGRLIGKEEL